METKFTNGPWAVDGSYVCQEGDDDVGICEVIPMDPGSDKGWFHGPVTDANAQLIAAAPELFEALREVVAYCEEAGIDWSCFVSARAAIAKATGGGA